MRVIYILNIKGALILIGSLILAFGSFKSFNFKLISFDLCKTVESIVYAKLLHCSNAYKNAFGLYGMVHKILWICARTSYLKEAFWKNKSGLKSIFSSKDNYPFLSSSTAVSPSTCSCGGCYILDYTMPQIRSNFMELGTFYNSRDKIFSYRYEKSTKMVMHAHRCYGLEHLMLKQAQYWEVSPFMFCLSVIIYLFIQYHDKKKIHTQI